MEEKSEGIIEISVPAERQSMVATEGERRSDQLRTEGEIDYGKIAGRAGKWKSGGDYKRRVSGVLWGFEVLTVCHKGNATKAALTTLTLVMTSL